MINALFLMEQHIGHRAFYLNLRKFVEINTTLKAEWVEITYSDVQPHLIERIPFLPEQISGSVVGREQVRRGLRRPYDIAIFNTQVPAVLGGGMTSRRPYILCTDITPKQYDQMAEYYNHHPDRQGLIAHYKNKVNIKVFNSASRLLPWSNWVRDSLILDYGVDPARIDVLPPGVDTNVWRPVERNNNDLIRILFVGGDFYRKGGQLLLEVFRMLPPNCAELILVTHSELTLEPGIRVVNNVYPNSPELIALYQACDIFVLPTQAEAFGMVAVEASAVGLPIIATSVGGLPDIVIEGKTGFLIAPSDLHALRERLLQFIQDANLRKRMGLAARERAIACFDARRNASRLAEILHTTLVK